MLKDEIFVIKREIKIPTIFPYIKEITNFDCGVIRLEKRIIKDKVFYYIDVELVLQYLSNDNEYKVYKFILQDIKKSNVNSNDAINNGLVFKGNAIISRANLIHENIVYIYIELLINQRYKFVKSY